MVCPWCVLGVSMVYPWCYVTNDTVCHADAGPASVCSHCPAERTAAAGANNASCCIWPGRWCRGDGVPRTAGTAGL